MPSPGTSPDVPASFHPAVQVAMREFRERHGTRLDDPLFVHDRAMEFAEEFARTCQGHDIPAEVISGLQHGEAPEFPGEDLVLAGNFAVLIPTQWDTARGEWAGQKVVDWTARQRGPSPVPLISDLDEWRRTWRPL